MVFQQGNVIQVHVRVDINFGYTNCGLTTKFNSTLGTLIGQDPEIILSTRYSFTIRQIDQVDLSTFITSSDFAVNSQST